MAEFINIYDEAQSELILRDNSSPTSQLAVPTLGRLNPASSTYRNAFFLEVNVYDATENFIFKLNSGLPLLQNSNGFVHLGPFHIHQGVYMEGEKHLVHPHGALVKLRDNQLNVFPINTGGFPQEGASSTRTWCIKPSEIFEIIKKIEDYELIKNNKFKIQYGIFQDVILLLGEYIGQGGN